ncbi:hypothetical protein MGMO_27c00060 [Methyloglobulus morosus KoM1]|uniref:Uncharacterized protein n=1 Tax=Methyloglobulus morosus KoM1 TaxID=1116472 RepID=V5C931_9GAMM|nr:hypothetical protein [Methyloglobulus morosus]ESS73263.1 hypothetical protein MGMO_27c00060 [Methyloglobulus morosus KoM1]
MDWTNFLLGVGASLVAAAIWQVFISVASYVPSKYPDIRGNWKASYIENGNQVCDTIHVKRQFGRKISGTIHSPGEGNDDVVYSFKGEFISNMDFKVSFTPVSQIHTDYGVGLFHINNNGAKISGSTISFNFESGKLEPREVLGVRENV